MLKSSACAEQASLFSLLFGRALSDDERERHIRTIETGSGDRGLIEADRSDTAARGNC
jgi:hypothetical protein